MKIISIIVACFNEKDFLPLFYKEINWVSKKMKFLKFKFLFINDGCSDATLNIIKILAKKVKK